MTDRRADDARHLDRRTMLRALGLGAAGTSLGGLGFLAGCSSDGGSTSATGGPSTTLGATTTTRAIPVHDPSKPYWTQGNFVGVKTEETVTDLTVTGTIPKELSGLFVRNGSNPLQAEPLHWFLGDGMVHGLRLDGGKASWYRNRFVQTPIYESGKDLLGFGAVPGKENGQSNVALVHHGGKLLATGEVSWPFELSLDDLSTVGPWDFDGKLGDAMTAHPKIDPATGRMHFFGYGIMKPGITYYAADPDGTIDVATTIPMDDVVMVHDFAITERDAVFWVGPVLFGSSPDAMYPDVPFHWDPAGPSKIGVMPLDGDASEIRWVDIPPQFAFHGLNAYRDGDDVVLLVHRQEEAFGVRGDLVDSFLTRWRIGTGGAELTFSDDRVSGLVMDLPTHDRRRSGRPTRHGWCATFAPVTAPYGFEPSGICHIDTETGTEDTWVPDEHSRAGEAFYVPASDGAPEGEGWLMTYVWNRGSDRSSFAVFDAMDVATGPVATVDLPVRVPYGFHGLWVPEGAT